MDPFEIAEGAEQAIGEIYAFLADFYRDRPRLHRLFQRLVEDEKEHVQRVRRWAQAWKKSTADQQPKVNVEPLRKLAQRAAAFSKELAQAEVIKPSAALGLAICIEQKMTEAHQELAQSELGGLFTELVELDEEHLGKLLQAMISAGELDEAPDLPCDQLELL